MFDILNRLMGQLHAGRATMHYWLQKAKINEHPFAAKFGLQIGFGAIALAMRKLDDFWEDQVPVLFPDREQRPPEGKWLVGEVKSRNLRETANMMIAHYADKTKWPLSEEEIISVIMSNGWETEEEVIDWTREAIAKVEAVRTHLNAVYGNAFGDGSVSL
jgi:hypothetical protein